MTRKIVMVPMLLLMTGCAALFPGLTTGNPVADMTAIDEVAVTTDGAIELAWQAGYPLLPPADQPAALAAYTKAQAVVTAAIQGDQDAIAAYEDGQAQDWSALIATVTAAVDGLVSAVQQLVGSKVGASHLAAAGVAYPHLVEALRGQANLHRRHAP
jgi:hypothetical protein